MKKKILFLLLSLPCVLVGATAQEEDERLERITAPASEELGVVPVFDDVAHKVGERWTIDTILVRVNGANILKSSLEDPRMSKGGSPCSLDELIEEELLCQKAAERHILPTEADVQRQVVAFKMKNDLAQMSDDDFEKELKENGFTLAKYKQQIGRMMAVENVRRAETDEKVVITSQQVQDFYNENPVYEKESYNLKKAILTDKEARDFKHLITDNKLAWKDLGWIEKDSLDEKFGFVSDLARGGYSEPVQLGEETAVFQLVDKKERRLKPLDERYVSIERELRDQKRSEFLNNLVEDLKAQASIIFLNADIA